MRRITLITPGAVCTARPSFVMPSRMARTGGVEKALYLRQWGGPFDALASRLWPRCHVLVAGLAGLRPPVAAGHHRASPAPGAQRPGGR